MKQTLKNVSALLVPLLFGVSPLRADYYTITTVAGDGLTTGILGDGGPATSAELTPYGMALDSNGDLLIADQYNCRIRKVDTNGFITTAIGDLGCGFAGDNQNISAAKVNVPVDLQFDGGGNLFIADRGNERIRRVDNGGTITTVAGPGAFGVLGDGGAATSAFLHDPSGVAFDNNGNLIIADSVNGRIRRVDGGNISTIAGKNWFTSPLGDGGQATDAFLFSPSDVVFAGGGVFYIADTQNSRIRRVDGSGNISTFAGGGSLSPYHDNNVDATSVIAPYPKGVSVDNGGNVFYGDGVGRVRKVDAAGKVTTIAGNMIYPLDDPMDGGPATCGTIEFEARNLIPDGNGNLYVSDGGNRVRLLTLVHATGAPPVITSFSGSGSQNVVDGQSLTLTVEATGTGPFHYQWFKQGTPATVNDPLPPYLSVGMDSPNYVTDAFHASDWHTIYHVMVRNAAGCATSEPAIIKVVSNNGVPVITNGSVTGTVGKQFSYQITATNSPTSFDATGLPAGLTIDKTRGLISGTPTQTAFGTVVQLSATNTNGTGTGSLGVVIIPDVNTIPVITGPFTASGQVGVSFSYQIAATNSPTSFNAGNLPSGLSIDSTLGLISGVPASSGTTTIGLAATNGSGSGFASLTLTIADIPRPSINSVPTAAATVGTLFTFQITATNNPTSFDATGLPPGLTLNTTNGQISGTPTQNGLFTVQLSATNSVGTGAASLAISVTSIGGGIVPAINSSLTAVAQVGMSFTYQITATQNPTGFNAINLPAGLAIDQNSGVISGSPSNADTYLIGLIATNGSGSGTATLTLAVAAGIVAPSITSALTADALLGQSFTYQITATNNPTGFAASGLPAGLTISSLSGLIHGTPTLAGRFVITLTASNTGGSGSAPLALTVANPPPQPTAPFSTNVFDPHRGERGLYPVDSSQAGSADVVLYSRQGVLKRWTISDFHVGRNDVIWDGTNDHGSIVVAAVYRFKLRKPDGQEVRGAFLVK